MAIVPEVETFICDVCEKEHLQKDDSDDQCACGLFLCPGCWEDDGHPCSGCDELICGKCIESSPELERCERCDAVFHDECWQGDKCVACSAARCHRCEVFTSCSVCTRPYCSACSEAYAQNLLWDEEGAAATCVACIEEAQDEKDMQEENAEEDARAEAIEAKAEAMAKAKAEEEAEAEAEAEEEEWAEEEDGCTEEN